MQNLFFYIKKSLLEFGKYMYFKMIRYIPICIIYDITRSNLRRDT